jgi:GntR family transcriptional regulator
MALRKTPEERKRKRENDKRAMHQRIAADLRGQILSGDIEPDGDLPSTSEMRQLYDSSPTTIQNAIRMLKEEGLVVGQPGKSVQVRPHGMRTMRPADYLAPAAPDKAFRWIDEAEKKGMRAEIELLDVAEVEPPLSVSKAFGLAAGGTAILRRQLLKLNGEPAELADCYYPAEIGRGTALAEPKKIKGGTPKLLAELGYPPRQAVDLVAARTPTFDEGIFLQLPVPDLPVLRTFRRVFTEGNRVIEVTVMAKASHLYQLEYDLTVP